MQYQVTQQVNRQRWEDEQQSVIDELQRRAQHDLEVQNPGSTITISGVEHTERAGHGATHSEQGPGAYLVDFVFEYTASGQPNTFAA